MAGYSTGGYGTAVSGSSSGTTADLIAATRRLLYGRDRQAMNQLAAAVGASDTTFTFTYTLAGIKAGATLCLDLEEVRVWEVDESAKSAVVQRGVNGSTVAAHTAGSVVAVEPAYSDYEIFAALNDDLLDLASPVNGLFQVKTVDLTAVYGQDGYDFDAPGYLGVLEVRYKDPSTLSGDWPVTGYTVAENLPTTSFPSGTAIFLSGSPAPQPVRVRYKATFDPLTNLTSAVAATGLPPSAFDLPPLGAALRIMAARPIARAQYMTQGETRRPDEVPVGSVIQAPAALRLLRQERVVAEASRLAAQWPTYVRDRITLT